VIQLFIEKNAVREEMIYGKQGVSSSQNLLVYLWAYQRAFAVSECFTCDLLAPQSSTAHRQACDAAWRST